MALEIEEERLIKYYKEYRNVKRMTRRYKEEFKYYSNLIKMYSGVENHFIVELYKYWFKFVKRKELERRRPFWL